MGVMSLWGTWKSDHGHPASFLVSFKGGALFGFAAAVTRFLAIIPE